MRFLRFFFKKINLPAQVDIKFFAITKYFRAKKPNHPKNHHTSTLALLLGCIKCSLHFLNRTHK
jgi:hypothetical protein